MELPVPVLVILTVVLVVILLWLLFGVWGRRRDADATVPRDAAARPNNLSPTDDVESPVEPAPAIGSVNMPAVAVNQPVESSTPVSSYTYPSEEITDSDVLEADVMTTEVANADVLRTEVADRSADLPLDDGTEDDLEIIEGIGPKIAAVLKQEGVTRFAQLASMAPERITEILRASGMRLADPHSWPEQARLAANGDMEGLKALQDRLTAGRS